MGGKASKEIDQLYKNVGEQGFRSILAKEKSPYQSLSYCNIHRQCMDRVAKIQEQGDAVIDESIKKSQNDYNVALKSLTAKDPDLVKKAQARSKKTLKQIVGYDEEMEKYEQIRRHMKQNFDIGRQELQNTIREQTRVHQGASITTPIKGYDDQPQQKKQALLREIQDNYAKKWIQKQQQQRKSGQVSKDIYQFNFTEKYRTRFEDLVPDKECEVTRNNMKYHFQKQLKQAMGMNAICC